MSALNESEAYTTAVGLLARREHSARELGGKLHSRGFAPAVVESVLARLVAERLQSDERYAEAYLRQRSGKGYGPERIRAEMRERGVSDSLIAASFRRAEEEGEVDWFELATATYSKKFGGRPIEDMKDKAKRQRFMQYRGFNHEQIAEAIDSNK
jgi:regulatory protein